MALALAALIVAACGGSSQETGDAPASAPMSISSAAVTVQPTSTLSPAGAATPGPSQAAAIGNGIVPDFELPRAGGGTVRLSDVYSRANTVLVFYRGYF